MPFFCAQNIAGEEQLRTLEEMQAGATARLHEAQAAELSAQGEETVSALHILLPTSCTNNTRQSNSYVDLATRNCVHVGDSLSVGNGSEA